LFGLSTTKTGSSAWHYKLFSYSNVENCENSYAFCPITLENDEKYDENIFLLKQ